MSNIIRDIDGIVMEKCSFKSVRKIWDAFVKDNENVHPFQYYDLSKTIKDHYLFFTLTSWEVPRCFKFSINGKVVLIAPLCRVYKGIEKPFTTFGSTATIASQDFIYNKEMSIELLSKILKILIDYCGKLTIWNIMTTSKTNNALRMLGYEPVKQYQCVRIPIKDGYQTYFKSLPKNSRQNIRTAYNRLAKDGLTFEIKCFKGRIKDGLFKNILDLYINRRRTRYRATSMIHDWFLRHYHFNTIALQKLHYSRTVVLYINNEIAAFWSGYEYQDGKSVMVPRLAINSDYSRYSPGMILINETMKLCESDFGYASFDLSKGNEKYKMAMGGEIYLRNKYICSKHPSTF